MDNNDLGKGGFADVGPDDDNTVGTFHEVASAFGYFPGGSAAWFTNHGLHYSITHAVVGTLIVTLNHAYDAITVLGWRNEGSGHVYASNYNSATGQITLQLRDSAGAATDFSFAIKVFGADII